MLNIEHYFQRGCCLPSMRKKRKTRGDTAASIADTGGLAFQRSLIRGILEASPHGILVGDGHDVVVTVNQRFFEAMGIPTDKVHGGQASTVIGTADKPILALAVQSVKDPDAFLARVKELYNDPSLDDHCEIELKDGRTIERHSTVLRSENQQ